jgi:hypothetical protein
VVVGHYICDAVCVSRQMLGMQHALRAHEHFFKFSRHFFMGRMFGVRERAFKQPTDGRGTVRVAEVATQWRGITRQDVHPDGDHPRDVLEEVVDSAEVLPSKSCGDETTETRQPGVRVG